MRRPVIQRAWGPALLGAAVPEPGRPRAAARAGATGLGATMHRDVARRPTKPPIVTPASIRRAQARANRARLRLDRFWVRPGARGLAPTAIELVGDEPLPPLAAAAAPQTQGGGAPSAEAAAAAASATRGEGGGGHEEEPLWTSDHFGLLLTLGGGETSSEVAAGPRSGGGAGRCSIL